MLLFTTAQYRRLLMNGDPILSGKDHKPVVKLFTPDAGATWLLSEIDPYERHMAYGLCDLGIGLPTLGYVDLNDITILGGSLGLPVERDRHFKATHPISVYAEAARQRRAITTDADALAKATTGIVHRQ